MVEQPKSQPKMSVILASSAVKTLGEEILCLSQEQIMKAKSSALSLSSNPTLSKCDQFSLIKYCFEMARYNFSREDCAYPVPYGNKVQAQIGYKGFREIAMRSNKYNNIDASIVYDCDKVKRNRQSGAIEVEFEEDVSKLGKAKPIGYFAYAINKNNELVNSVYMSKEQCEHHGRIYSKTYNSTWGKDENTFNKMCMKTVIKQLCGKLDATPELERLIAQDQIVYGKKGETNEYSDNPLNEEFIKQSNVRNLDEVVIEQPVENQEVEINEDEEPF